MLAMIAGEGSLPSEIARAHPNCVFVRIEGVTSHNPGVSEISARYEALGKLFGDLRAHNVSQVCFAGAMARPALDPAAFDRKMQALVPRLMPALQGGDDALLRLVIEIFEEEGFAVKGAHELLPDLTAQPGALVGAKPSPSTQTDAQRACAILDALAPVDVGQGAVVAAGLCLGVETIQGTDFLLNTIAQTPPHLRRAKGVFVKRPKTGQDLRIDMPAIGPNTIRAAALAGLEGIVIAAGSVMILERNATLDAAKEAGLFLMAE